VRGVAKGFSLPTLPPRLSSTDSVTSNALDEDGNSNSSSNTETIKCLDGLNVELIKYITLYIQPDNSISQSQQDSKLELHVLEIENRLMPLLYQAMNIKISSSLLQV
jgi:hypothetical protein